MKSASLKTFSLSSKFVFNALFNYLQSLSAPGTLQHCIQTLSNFEKMNSLGNKLSADTERESFVDPRNLNYSRSRKKKTSKQQQTLSDLCSVLHCRKISVQLFHHPAEFSGHIITATCWEWMSFCFVPFYRREIMDYQSGHYTSCYLTTWINFLFSLNSGYGFGALELPLTLLPKRETRSQGIKL